jgi:hypothetical protein
MIKKYQTLLAAPPAKKAGIPPDFINSLATMPIRKVSFPFWVMIFVFITLI